MKNTPVKPTNVAKPFDPADNYVKLHRALFTLYTRLPDFKAQHIVMYAYLCDKYNAKLGYAYPTHAQIAEDLSIGVNSPSVIAQLLRKYGLIEYQRRNNGSRTSNYVYYINAPITDKTEFERAFGINVKTTCLAEEEAPLSDAQREIIDWL